MNPHDLTGQGPDHRASAANGRSALLPSSTAASSSTPPSSSSSKAAAPVGTVSAAPPRRGWRDLESRLLAVVGRLTERDRQLCRLLDEHRVLTTAQIADVAFTGERRARMRLAELYALDVLDRFRPQAWASPAPYHWVLGPLGAALRAAETGHDLADVSWRRRLAHDLAASQRLTHLVGTNGIFTALLKAARTGPGCALVEWWSEQRCAKEWGEVVRPDGYGIWTDDETSVPFLVEYDNGTERLDRLAQKLDGYARLAQAAGHPTWVLFSFPSPRREAEARRVLTHNTVPVATAARTTLAGPDGPIWLPVTSSPVISGRRRLRLAELAGLTASDPARSQ